MKVLIEVPKHLYNNIMALSSVALGRIPYKGIIAGALKAIKTGTVLPENSLILDKDKLEAAEIGEDDE